MLAADLAPAKPDLRQIMAADPSLLFEKVAKEHDVTLREVLEAMPEETRRFADGAHFIDAMNDIAAWGDVTFIIHTDDGIFEISGPVPSGALGRGYFNLQGRTGLHGHLRHERCAAICFVERPFMGRESASVLFVNTDGGIMFKVFVGRGEGGALKPEQHAAFRALRDRLSG